MAGHNKWSKVKHVKAAVDAKKGKLFTKLIKEITVSARIGGGSPDGNPRLRAAIQAAKDASMPRDNVDRAIKKGTGELEGAAIEEITYEGYGPGGVAVLVEATTDNKNRTVSDLRRLFKSGGGSLGEQGSVGWMFERCGQLVFRAEGLTEDQVMEVALEAGANDVSESDGIIEVTTEMGDVYKVKETFDNLGMHPAEAGLSYLPKSTVQVSSEEDAEKLLSMLDAIENHDDTQKVHANFEMDDALMEKLNK